MTWHSEQAPSKIRTARQRGFTLIEVIVVMAILGLVLAMVAARGPLGVHTLSARAAANELAAGFRRARAEAITSNQPIMLTVDLKAHAWRIGTGKPTAIPADLQIAVTTVGGQTAGTEVAGFRFLPDGSATGGRVELADGKRRIQVGIEWLNGRVSVADAQ
jgi:general secretion pathway protein H